MRLSSLLNPFGQFVLCFQYVSHRVLRWTVTPFLMILAFVLNILIVWQVGGLIYTLLLLCQVAFYGASLLGLIFERRHMKVKIFFIPYYFCMMNYAVIAGISRYLKGSQSAIWEKSKRK